MFTLCVCYTLVCRYRHSCMVPVYMCGGQRRMLAGCLLSFCILFSWGRFLPGPVFTAGVPSKLPGSTRPHLPVLELLVYSATPGSLHGLLMVVEQVLPTEPPLQPR